MSVLLRIIAVVVLWAFSTAAHAATVDDARNKGLAWLFSHQNGDGSWKTASGLQIQPTAAALEALHNAGVKQGYPYSVAQAWLGNAEAVSTDSLARQNMALFRSGANVSAHMSRLIAMRRSSTEGWGAYNKYSGSFPDTSLAMDAIFLTGTAFSDSDKSDTRAFIIFAQNVDGGWPYIEEEPATPQSRLIPTAHNIITLSRYKAAGWSADNYIDDGINWLATQQKPDGGFAEDPSATAGSVYETALAYLALAEAKKVGNAAATGAQSIMDGAQNFLLSRQQSDGGWGSDPFLTALVLQTLPLVTLADTDKDGIPDTVETLLGTNPSVADGRWLAKGNGQGVAGGTSPVFVAAGLINQSFSQTLPTSGTAPYTWGIVSGNLPDGLSLGSGTGVISGTPVTAGTFNFTYKVTDAAGSITTVAGQIVVVPAEAIPPTGTIAINAGINSTKSTAVTLSLSATDNNGIVTQMQFSNDNVNWSTAEAYATSKAWVLATGDGSKTVYARFKDVAGNWSTVYSDTIVLDTTSPSTASSPVGGLYNASQSVTLACGDGTGSGCGKIYYTTDGTTPTTASSVYSTPITVAATATVKYFAVDIVGNSEVVKSQTYTIDTTPPTGTVAVNNGAASTNSTSATLNVACSDANGCGQMQFSNDNTNWSTAEAYATSKAWTLATGDGTKTVYAKFKDAAGNWSTSLSDTIMLDTAAATTSASPSGGVYNASKTVTLSCSDGTGSGCNKIYYTTNGTTPTTASSVYSAPLSIVATTTLQYFATDLAGNSEAVKSQAYAIDTTPPTGTITINSGATYTGTRSATLTLTCSDTNGCGQMQFSNDNSIWSTAEAYTTSKAWTLAFGDGTTTVYARFKDAAGNWSSAYSDTIILDTTAPTGTITINGGAAYTNSTIVTLGLTCGDGASGCSQVQFSNDNTNWSTAETYAASKAWTLASGDGTKRVYVKFMDAAGNWSSSSNNTIKLDATAPVTTISPTGGVYNTSKTVTLSCGDGTGSSGCNKIYYTTNGTTPTTASSVYTSSLSITATTTLKYFATDLAGNSEAVKTQIYTIDTTLPTGSIVINSGVTYATSASVTLALTCSDVNGCSQMQFSNNNSTWSTAETYAASKAWTLASGDGTKTVYVKFKDAAGNWSSSYSDTIVLDTLSPSTTASPSGGMYNTSKTVTLTCSDGTGSGCSRIYYSVDGSTPTTASSVYSAPISVTNTTLKYFAVDLAGNSETVKTQTYAIDTVLPTGSITINSGAASTSSASVTLSLTCTDANGCSQMQFSSDNVSWYAAEAYAPTKTWTLASGSGTRTVYAKFKDVADNWSGTYSDTINLAPYDITITAISGQTSANITQQIPVSYTVKNLGDSSTGSFNVGIYLSTDSTITTGDILIGSDTFSYLSSMSQTTRNITARIPSNAAAGTYYIGVIADNGSTVAEADETNNALSGNQIAVTAVSPDLTLATVMGPAGANSSEPITVTTTIRNQGGTTSGFYIYLYLSTDATITTSDTRIRSWWYDGSIAAGAQATINITGWIPASILGGNYYIGAIIDPAITGFPAGYVTESNETNNSLAGNLVAVTTLTADLTITAVSAPASANRTEPINVATTIRNQGGSTGSFYVNAYLSTDSVITTSDTYLGQVWYDTSISTGAQTTINITGTIPATMMGGNYYIGAIVDPPTGYVAESNETNNALAGSLVSVTTTLPDLTVTAVSGPANANITEPITIATTIKNLGGSTGRFYISIYFGGVSVGYMWYEGSIASGAQTTVNVPIRLPVSLTAGSYTIWAVVDSGGNLSEGNESNNSLSGNQITVTAVLPDLTVTSVSGPTTGTKGQPITVSNTIGNTGGRTGDFYVNYYLSTDAAITADDTFIGSYRFSSLDGGTSTTINVPLTLPPDLAGGTYYIGAIADVSSVVTESSEANNALTGNQITVAP